MKALLETMLLFRSSNRMILLCFILPTILHKQYITFQYSFVISIFVPRTYMQLHILCVRYIKVFSVENHGF